MSINEAAHAKLLFQLALGVWNTYEYLYDAINGEQQEWQSMYPEFARIARQEGYTDIATVFEQIGEIEKDHEMRFATALARLHMKDNALHSAADELMMHQGTAVEGYRCKICGAVYQNKEEFCVVCGHENCFEKTIIYKK